MKMPFKNFIKILMQPRKNANLEKCCWSSAIGMQKLVVVCSNPWLVVMVWEVGIKEEIYWLTGVVKIV